jgi:hypothetical protein
MGSFVLLGVFAFAILLPFQLAAVRTQAWRQGIKLTSWDAARAAVISSLAALGVGGALGYAIMFGPSHVTGDFIGLPWYTMIPAMIVGFISAGRASKALIGWCLKNVANRVE